MPDPTEQANEFCRQGNAFLRAGKLDEAINAYQNALKLRPDYGEIYSNLGQTLLTLGRVDESLDACRQAVNLRPSEPRAHNNLANALVAKGQINEAIVAYTRAIELQPNLPEPIFNLANALRDAGYFDRAISMYEKAIQLLPDFATAMNNLATVLKDTAQIEPALEWFARAVEAQPQNPVVHSGLLYSLYFHPSQNQQKVLEEHQRFSERHAHPLKNQIPAHANDRDPKRRLRIGYVSPDFRGHCQSLFTVPLLSHHDHQNFEIFCYSSVIGADAITQRIQTYSDVWRNVAGMSDADLAQLIRADKIDILIDLTMHMSGGRPLLFARKPAPLQVAWLAYPGTTGLDTIDYRLTDPYLDPPDLNDPFYTEKSVRLPHSFWCYDPLTDQPSANPLPALSNGFITFGCLNNFAKVHDGVLSAWSKVLEAVPSSKMILLVPEGRAREGLACKLKIDPNRLQFVPHKPRQYYLENYLQIDLGLDTFPVNGHTTSLDSLWMGVPVVSLFGTSAISRAGHSQMTNLGLRDQFVAATPEQFIQLAVQRANDLSQLSELRQNLRQHLNESPLMDGRRFARNVESAYRFIWQRWCKSETPQSFTVAEPPIQQQFDLAIQHHKSQRFAEAESLYREVLHRKPNNADVMHLLGVLLSQTDRQTEAVDLINRAISINPNNGNFQYNLGLVYKSQERKEEAIESFQRAIAQKPDHADAYHELGNLFSSTDRLEEAGSAYREAARLRPKSAQIWEKLATTLKSLNFAAAAAVAYAELAKLRPQDAPLLNELGNMLVSSGQFPEAIAVYRRAMEIDPKLDSTYCNLGGALQAVGKFDEAIAILSQRPNLPEALYNMANALQDKGEFDQAIAAFRKAIALNPHFSVAHNNLATALKDAGKIPEALDAYARGMAGNPAHSAINSSRIFTLHYDPRSDGQSILREHLQWNKRHAEPLAGEIQPHLNDSSPDRRLKIGYVSPDFSNHCQSHFTIPLLTNHDHKNFEIYCYSSPRRPDEFTQHIASLADHWRICSGLSDAQVAKIIHNDKIDILIDLTMHMSNGRLLTFARKPAPVQISWLAYPSTTGVSAIDYRLTDPYLDPPGEGDENYSEQSIRLPHSFWIYDPLAKAPQVNELPALKSGYMTFGCLNNFCKVNDEVLRLWAKVMQAVPSSKLILLSPRGQHREKVLEILNPARVEFVDFLPRPQYLLNYNRIDIGLDTFPYNGHTTSLDSLWMGVPVVSLCGKTSVSRAGFSQCSNLGLTEKLVAHSPGQFIELAGNLANDLNSLNQLRRELRTRIEKSPIMNAKLFAHDIETVYRTVWKKWCDSKMPIS